MIGPEISKSLSDVTFGMLLMSQLACAMALYSKGRRHNLQLMMFRFMLYMIFLTLFEFVYFYLVCPVHSIMTCPLTDILEMSVVPCALLIIIRLTSPLTRQWKLIIPNAAVYYGTFVIFYFTWNMTLYKVILGFTIIYAIGIIVYGVVAVNKFNRRLKMNFSDESLSLYWLKYIMIIYILMLIVWTAATIYISDGMQCLPVYWDSITAQVQQISCRCESISGICVSCTVLPMLDGKSILLHIIGMTTLHKA